MADFFTNVGNFWNGITGATDKAASINTAAATQTKATNDAQLALDDAFAKSKLALESGNTDAIAETNRALEAAKQALATAQQQAISNLDTARAQFDPYMQAGTDALGQQRAILGLGGDQAQQDAYTQIQNSPAFRALSQAGQSAILANASATGGVRGGNTQGAIAQFGTQNLANLLQQQYANLSGLSTAGQNAAGSVAGLYGQQADLVANNGNNLASLISGSGANISQLLAGQGSDLANLLFQQGQGRAATMADLGAIESGRQLGVDQAYADSKAAAWKTGGALLGGIGGFFAGGPMGAIKGASLGSSVFGGGK